MNVSLQINKSYNDKKINFSVYLKRRKLVLNLNNTSLIISQVRKFQKNFNSVKVKIQLYLEKKKTVQILDF